MKFRLILAILMVCFFSVSCSAYPVFTVQSVSNVITLERLDNVIEEVEGTKPPGDAVSAKLIKEIQREEFYGSIDVRGGVAIPISGTSTFTEWTVQRWVTIGYLLEEGYSFNVGEEFVKNGESYKIGRKSLLAVLTELPADLNSDYFITFSLENCQIRAGDSIEIQTRFGNLVDINRINGIEDCDIKQLKRVKRDQILTNLP